MFQNGQFGKHVFMQDLLSQPVEIEQPEPAQLPPVQQPPIIQQAGNQDDGLSSLGGGLGALLGLGLGRAFQGGGASTGGNAFGGLSDAYTSNYGTSAGGLMGGSGGITPMGQFILDAGGTGPT